MKKQHHQTANYLVANETDENWGLYATTIGCQHILPNMEYPPRGHPPAYSFSPDSGRVLQEYILLYITKGEGWFELEKSSATKISAGNVLFLFPGQWHTYRPAKEMGWNEYWLGFTGSYMKQLDNPLFFSQKKPVYDVGFNEQMVALFNQGIEVAAYQKTAHQQVLAGIISMLLGLVFYSEKNNSFRDSEVISKINQAKLIMRESTDVDVTPESIAQTLNLGYSSFRKVFKQYTGFSPRQYQLEIKFQKSKELLSGTAMTINEIASYLNFDSLSYFVQFFKSRTGLSPGEFRQRMKTGK
ncbi:AraC family transcriptional regulator [Danxiaibacter flavus]|uniref:AraC family transcriptional regulator n=1 Tax=Danxiaibacter flavus TaxID=3049108 RepID=A0ABV3ZMY6_9BACT|nr:AraC family transcriptional regulator [Chitinophagaceae bacterium DXS]